MLITFIIYLLIRDLLTGHYHFINRVLSAYYMHRIYTRLYTCPYFKIRARPIKANSYLYSYLHNLIKLKSKKIIII